MDSSYKTDVEKSTETQPLLDFDLGTPPADSPGGSPDESGAEGAEEETEQSENDPDDLEQPLTEEDVEHLTEPYQPLILELQGALNEHDAPGGRRTPFLCLLPFFFVVTMISLLWLYVAQLEKSNSGWHASYVTIRTKLGDARGRVQFALNIKRREPQKVYHFQALPYAEIPPIGTHRFKTSALRYSPWTGVLDAAHSSPFCMQVKSHASKAYHASGYIGIDDQMSEDCLYASVWTPNVVTVEQVNWDNVSETPTELLPVYFHIHGGGLRHGFAEESQVHQMAANANVVMVKPNYRLGPLGFLPEPEYDMNGDYGTGDYDYGTPEDKSFPEQPGTGGANGLYDLIVALQWVKANIERFGGNPNNITVSGHSQGSIGACALAVSPLAKGLFQNVVLMSGVCTGKLMGIQSREHGINASRVFVSKFGARNLQDLMQVDATMLCSWKSDPQNNISHPRLDIERRGFFYDYTHAFVDGYVLLDTPRNLYIAGKVNIEKAIIGHSVTDGTFTLDELSDAPTSFHEAHLAIHKFMRGLYNSGLVSGLGNVTTPQVEQLYNITHHSSNHSLIERWVMVGGDAEISCPGLQLAEFMRDAGVEVYTYNFAYGPLSSDPAVKQGWVPPMDHSHSNSWVSHGMEQPFVFGYKMDHVEDGTRKMPKRVKKFIYAVMNLFTSLSRGGPLEICEEKHFSNFSDWWQPMGAHDSIEDGTIPTMVLNENSHLISGDRLEYCTYWVDVLEDPV